MKLCDLYLMKLKQKIWLILLFLSGGIMTSSLSGQGGLSIYSGFVASFSQDLNVTPAGTGHYGHFIGADFRLNSGDMYFAGGGRYYRTSLLAEKKVSFFSNAETYSYFTARFGFGFNLKHFSYRTRLRSKLFGVFNFSGNTPQTMMEIPGYEKLNDASGGIATGLGMDIGPLTLDLEYQKGLINSYRKQQDSKFDVWSFAIGVFF